MIQSYLETLTLLPSNASPISFERDCIRTRSASCQGWLQHSQGLPLYKILEGGNYEVTFNANISSDTAGVVAFGLYEDGILLPGTTVIETIAAAGDFMNVSFTKVVPICCRGDATLTVQSVPSVITGPSTAPVATATQIPTIQNANLTITRKA